MCPAARAGPRHGGGRCAVAVAALQDCPTAPPDRVRLQVEISREDRMLPLGGCRRANFKKQICEISDLFSIVMVQILIFVVAKQLFINLLLWVGFCVRVK